jgi:hypothetical protein
MGVVMELPTPMGQEMELEDKETKSHLEHIIYTLLSNIPIRNLKSPRPNRHLIIIPHFNLTVNIQRQMGIYIRTH